MRTLRNLTLSFLLVLAALGFHPVPTQASPEAPGSDCLWVYSPSGGIYSCSWGCDYFYDYSDGEWVLIGQNCVSLD